MGKQGQHGQIRAFSSVDEKTSKNLARCPRCHVNAVPRGVTSTRKYGQADPEEGGSPPTVAGEKVCPNCNFVFRIGNWEGVETRAKTIVITAPNFPWVFNNDFIKVEVKPEVAHNRKYILESEDVTRATVDAENIVASIMAGEVTLKATAIGKNVKGQTDEVSVDLIVVHEPFIRGLTITPDPAIPETVTLGATQTIKATLDTENVPDGVPVIFKLRTAQGKILTWKYSVIGTDEAEVDFDIADIPEAGNYAVDADINFPAVGFGTSEAFTVNPEP